MHLEFRARTTPSRWPVAFAALLVGATWAIGGLMPLGGQYSDPMTVLDQASSLTFSAMLAVFALVAWLVVRLTRPSRWILAVTAIMGIAGIVAGIGNFAEEMLRIPGAEYVYGLGFFGLLGGMIGTTIVLLVRREVVPLLLVALSIAGFMIAAGRGPNILPVIWVGFAAWVLVRRHAVVDAA